MPAQRGEVSEKQPQQLQESKEIKNYWYWNWVLIFLFSVKYKIFQLFLFSCLFNSQNHKKQNKTLTKKKKIWIKNSPSERQPASRQPSWDVEKLSTQAGRHGLLWSKCASARQALKRPLGPHQAVAGRVGLIRKAQPFCHLQVPLTLSPSHRLCLNFIGNGEDAQSHSRKRASGGQQQSAAKLCAGRCFRAPQGLLQPGVGPILPSSLMHGQGRLYALLQILGEAVSLDDVSKGRASMNRGI